MIEITRAAAHFGVELSTLRFWERRGLLTSHRATGGRRCYDEDQLYRIALIQLWRQTGQLSIAQIGELVGTADSSRSRGEMVRAALDRIDEQMHRLDAAREYLAHLNRCRHPGPPEMCTGFRARARIPQESSDD